ncbi:hypothetical protein GF336_06815 [Candidatus Woesearchaeota archaeon]|nr:hypothetical protein [Candidatus Woesearchaeota archaeon]
MKSFQSILEDIRDINIQGARNVARASVDAIRIVAHKNRDKDKKEILDILNNARLKLIKARITEPAMRNCLNYIFFDINSAENITEEIHKRAKKIESHFDISKEKISEIGSRKIIGKSIVFTHCHSSTVTNILKKSKKEKKRFKVYNTETRPLFQGRITAKELAKAGIPVRHFVDSAARLALKKADIMLIGADAITSEGKVVNKIGSELFAEVADKYDVPLYVCTDSWKFDPETVFGYEEEIETRKGKEVWMNPPKGVVVDNHAFENIDTDLITGIISEFGVYRPEVFIEEIRRVYPWIL